MKKDRIFQDGYVYVFSKKYYLSHDKDNKTSECYKGSWQNKCNGQIVDVKDENNGYVKNSENVNYPYVMSANWCKAIRRVK